MPRENTPYRLPAWRPLRDKVLRRDNHLCKIGDEGCTIKATEVDHITSWRLGRHLWLDPGNLRAACRRCNRGKYNRITLEHGDRRDIPEGVTIQGVAVVERSKGRVWDIRGVKIVGDVEIVEVTHGFEHQGQNRNDDW